MLISVIYTTWRLEVYEDSCVCVSEAGTGGFLLLMVSECDCKQLRAERSLDISLTCSIHVVSSKDEDYLLLVSSERTFSSSPAFLFPSAGQRGFTLVFLGGGGGFENS